MKTAPFDSLVVWSLTDSTRPQLVGYQPHDNGPCRNWTRLMPCLI
jgi:hypothetical protein